MKIQILMIMSVCLLVLTACTATPTGNIAKEEQFKVGYVGPLTGDASPWGIPPKEGIELAAEDSSIKTYYEDDQCDPAEAVSAITKLTEVQEVDGVIGAVCSSSTLAIAPILEAKGIPLISPASTNPDITNAGDYIFRVVPSDSYRGRVAAEVILGKDYGDVAILSINNAGGQGITRVFKDILSDSGVDFFEQKYAESEKDFRTMLKKIDAGDYDAIAVVSYPRDTGLITKEIKKQGIDIPIYYLTEAPDDPSVRESMGEDAVGSIYFMPEKIESAEKEKFVSEFKNYFGKEPNLYAAEGYDAFHLFENAFDECADDGECIKEYFYSVQGYDGASGTITFDENGDVQKEMDIIRITEKGSVVMQGLK